MSDSVLRTCLTNERVVSLPLHSNPQSNQIQNQRQVQNLDATGAILSSTSLPAHRHRRNGFYHPRQSGGHYTMSLPSSSSTSSTSTPYGPTLTSPYSSREAVSSIDASPSSTQTYPHPVGSVHPYVPPPGSGSVSFNTNLVRNSVNSDSSGGLAFANLFGNSSASGHGSSSMNSPVASLPYTSPHSISGSNGAQTQPSPVFNRNATSQIRRREISRSEHNMGTRSRGANSNSPSDLPISILNHSTNSTGDQSFPHPPARRNLLSRNECESVTLNAARNTAGSNNTFANVELRNSNDANALQSPPPPAPTSGSTSFRRTRKARRSAGPAQPNVSPSTSSNRKLPAKTKAPKTRKQDQKKIQPKESQEQCSICLEVPSKTEEATIDGCHHRFCFQCIEKWSDRENTCPLCKLRFSKIVRVNKPPPKKRKKGDAPRAKNTKKVKHRDQRADIGIGNFLASIDGVVPQAITQLFLGPMPNRLMTITRGNATSTRVNNNNQRIRLFSHQSSMFPAARSSTRTNNSESSFSLEWTNAASSPPPRRRSSRIGNSGRRQRSESNSRGGESNSAGRSAERSNTQHFFPFNAFDQIDPRVRDIIFDRHQDFRSNGLNSNEGYNETTSEDDDSDPDYGALVSHLNLPFDFSGRNGNDGIVGGNQRNSHLDFFVRHSQLAVANNGLQPNPAPRSYALNLEGGDTADTALEIQDSDDEVEIAEGSDLEIEVLVE